MALSAYPGVFRFLSRHRLWSLQFVPALISLVITGSMIVAFYLLAGGLANWLGAKTELPWRTLDQTLILGIRVLTFLLLALAFLFVQKHIVLVLLSPFLRRLAEATLLAVRPDAQPCSLTPGESLSRSARINLGNLATEWLINLLFLLGNFIPLVGPFLAGIGLFFNQSRFLGYGLMDFPLEHRGMSVRESVAFVRQRTGTCTGLGAGYIILMLVPLIGWMFAPTFGTVAGTLLAAKELGDR